MTVERTANASLYLLPIFLACFLVYHRTAFHINAMGSEIIQINGVPNDWTWSRIRSKPWTVLIGADALRLAPVGPPGPSGFALVLTDLLVRP